MAVKKGKRKADDDNHEERVVRRKASEAPYILHDSNAVAVHVGKAAESQTFIVRKDLLVAHSSFFAAALRSEWKEGQERVVSLPEDTPESFAIFCSFLCTGQIFSSKEDDYRMMPGSASTRHSDEEWVRLVDCWCLGQKILSITFKDGVTDAIVAKMQDSGKVPYDLHQTIYPNSSSTSSVRKLLVDIAVWRWKFDTLEKCKVQEGWAQFFLDVAVRLQKLTGSNDEYRSPFHEKNTCIYHEHVAESKPCYKTMF